MRVRRITPGENLNLVAAEQIRSWLGQAALVTRASAAATLPILTFDAGYDPVQLHLAVADLPVCLLVRLRAGRCFYADPTAQPPTGRPRRHGAKFGCDDPTTWPVPADTWTTTDVRHGRVSVKAWNGLHALPQNHATRGTRRPRPLIRGTLIRLEVERLPRPTKAPTPLWFWWSGPTPPDLAEVWRAYSARFSIEHTFRFIKQTLRWTTPKLRSPAAADRWTWLLILAYVQLRLARGGRRPALTLATAAPSGATRPCPRAPRLFAAPPKPEQPRKRAKTLRTLAGTSQRHALATCSTLPGGQIDALICAALRLFALIPAIILVAGHLVLVKMQA